MLPDEDARGASTKKTVVTAGGANPNGGGGDGAEGAVGNADAIGDPENPTSGEPKSIDEKALDAQRLFLRNVYLVLCAQWALMVVVVVAVTYWHGLRLFVQHMLRPIELTLLVPFLVSSIVLLLVFKTDATKNLYCFGAFTGAFIACVAVGSTFAYDDHWLLFGFVIVCTYVHVFALLQLDSVWERVLTPQLALKWTLNTAVALALAATFVVSFLVCAWYRWWHYVPGATAFGGAILVYGIADTYLLVKNLAPEDVLIALICLYTDPFNVVVSLFAYCIKSGADFIESMNKGPSTANNAFD